MARVDFNKDFLDLTENEELIIEGLLSVYELWERKPFYKRWTLRTHRITKINRFAFYENAISEVKKKGAFSKGFVRLADEAYKILERKIKKS